MGQAFASPNGMDMVRMPTRKSCLGFCTFSNMSSQSTRPVFSFSLMCAKSESVAPMQNSERAFTGSPSENKITPKEMHYYHGSKQSAVSHPWRRCGPHNAPLDGSGPRRCPRRQAAPWQRRRPAPGQDSIQNRMQCTVMNSKPTRRMRPSPRSRRIFSSPRVTAWENSLYASGRTSSSTRFMRKLSLSALSASIARSWWSAVSIGSNNKTEWYNKLIM